MSGDLERLSGTPAGRGGLPGPLRQELAVGPQVYEPSETTFIPCLSLEDAASRIPGPVRQMVDSAAGEEAERYASIDFSSGGVDSDAPSSFLYMAFGKGGFGRAAGRATGRPSVQGETWTVSYRRRGIELGSVRHTEEGGLGAIKSRHDDQPTGPTNNGRPALFDDDFRGNLGNLPVATQRFIQSPFMSDQPVEWDYKTMRSPTDGWMADQCGAG